METRSIASILDLTEADLAAWCVAQGAKSFAAKQIFRWIWKKGVLDPMLFTDLTPALREALAQNFNWELPRIDSMQSSEDGSEKFLLRLHDGRFIETMLMPTEDRVTICVSSQVGCRMACTFCQTGKLGFGRNLTSGEILSQLMIGNRRLVERGIERKISNVVFMGMGEPLDNYDNVVNACRTMTHADYFGLSRHRVTVSTSGLAPELRRLAKDVSVRVAISLHSADDAQRSGMMPVNQRYPLSELKAVLLEYPHDRDGITFEYVMISGVNDSITHAKKLVKFLHGLKARVNLIPMNPHPGVDMVATDEANMRAFQKYLSERSIPAPVRYSRGQDVSGACGQMAAKRDGESHLPPRRTALARHREYLEHKKSGGGKG